MTRRHFEAIAAITASISNDETRRMVATKQADYLATTNDLFDRSRFLTACGIVES